MFDKKRIPSNIYNLFPLVAKEKIVQVGRRLENASERDFHKNRVILPKDSQLSKINFESLHRRLYHVPPQCLLNAVRLKFWLLSSRLIVNETIHQWIVCFKNRAILIFQIMGNLLGDRVNISSPFTVA